MTELSSVSDRLVTPLNRFVVNFHFHRRFGESASLLPVFHRRRKTGIFDIS